LLPQNLFGMILQKNICQKRELFHAFFAGLHPALKTYNP